jgi:hypothetical protein
MIEHLSGKYVTDLSLGDAEAENNRKILAFVLVFLPNGIL